MTAMSRYLPARVCLVLLASLVGVLPLQAAAKSSKPAEAKSIEAKALEPKALEPQPSAPKEADAAPAQAESVVPATPAETVVELPANAYQLKEGDELEISVWREETLTKKVRVLPDGSVTFPLAGYLAVAGLTSDAVEKLIAQRLQAFLSDPVVTVVVEGINGNRAYVIGNVLKPGPFVLDAPTTVLQALSLAGGLGKFADEGAIRVLRAQSGAQEVLPVRYKDLITGKDLATNVQLKAGDTILVP